MKGLPRWTQELWKAIKRAGWHKKTGWRRRLAKKLGVTPGAVTRWLNGERIPSWKYRRKLSSMLRLDPGVWL